MSSSPPDESRAGRASRESVRVSAGLDLGHEPPLNAAGGAPREVDRRDVNLRWLGASVLTGVTGAVLIGASIYISIEGATTAPAPPERATVGAVSAASDAQAQPETTARKGDRLNRTETVASAKQSFRAPMTIRNGDREAIKVRQFVRVATNLSMASGAFAADIPRFDPARLLADDDQDRAAEPPPELADADVSVLRRDLATVAIDANAPALSDADVLNLLREEQRASLESGLGTAVSLPARQMLLRTLRQPEAVGESFVRTRTVDAPFSSLVVRLVPENVTNLPKLDQRGSGPLVEEREVVMKKGETIETVLRAYGAAPDQISAISTALSARIKTASLTEGQHLRILIAPGPRLGDPRQIMRVIVLGDHGIDAIAAANDRGVFVSVTPLNDEAGPQTPAVAADDEDQPEEDDGQGVRLYDSLYETALKNDVPRKTIAELVRIFGYDVDFQRRVSPGDTFEVFYGADEDGGPPEILYASLTVGGEARRVYRYLGDDGSVDFFDESGRSLKKFLLRKPIAEGILRSGFGSRYHPILGYTRPHTGVDWANKIGTPILAAGNGTIIKAGWESGYGRRIEIQHANGYETTYNHMSGFAKGIAPGAKVQQGQVIGYLGNTGLATGPHLHYEVLINGSFVDPLKIRLPKSRELEGRGLAEFGRQREQIDDLMSHANAPASVAQRAELR